jgi:hypothetical protein
MKKAKGLWNKYSEKYNVLCTLNSHVQGERTRFKKANGWHPCICRSTMLCWSKSTLRAWKLFCNNAIEAPDSHGKTWNYNPFEEIKSKILMLCQVDVLQGGEPIYQTIPTSRSSYYQERLQGILACTEKLILSFLVSKQRSPLLLINALVFPGSSYGNVLIYNVTRAGRKWE